MKNTLSLMENKKKILYTVCLWLFVAAGLFLAIAQPCAGLDDTGNIVLGAFVVTLTVWVFRPGGGSFTIGVAILILGGMIAGLPMVEMTSGFTSPSLWLLIPAMFFGYTLLKTGLGKRIVFFLFKGFNPTYKRLLAGWFIVGVLFSLLTPSITVRFLILTPIAVSVADACRLDKGHKGRSLIVISAWAASVFPGTAWLNGSLYGPLFTSYLPEGLMRDLATPQMWLKAMGPPWLLFSAIFLSAIYLFLKPDHELAVTREDMIKMYDELGPASRDEKICLAVFVLMLMALAAQSFLPYTTNQVLLGGFIILLFSGVLTAKDITQGIGWDTVMFFGCILGMSRLLATSGISDWVAPVLKALLDPIAANGLLFVLALYGLCLVLRFFDVTQGWIIAAILTLATPMLYEVYGIHPLICLMVFICAGNLFFFHYHQPWIGQAEAVIGDRGWAGRHLQKASVIYAILAALLLIACRFYWQLIGLWG